MEIVKPFIGTPSAGVAFNQGMAREQSYRAYFTNGDRWVFKAMSPTAAQRDARFWAEFTGRELSAVAAL